MLEDLYLFFGAEAGKALEGLSLSYKVQLPLIVDSTTNKSSLSLRTDITLFNTSYTKMSSLSFQYKGCSSSSYSIIKPIKPCHFEGKSEAQRTKEETFELVRKKIEAMNSFGSLHYCVDASDIFWLSFSRESILPMTDEFSCKLETVSQLSKQPEDVFNCLGFTESTNYLLKLSPSASTDSSALMETLLTERIFNAPTMLEDRIDNNQPFHLQSQFSINSKVRSKSSYDGVIVERTSFSENPTFKYSSVQNSISLDLPIYSSDPVSNNLISSTSFLSLDCASDRKTFIKRISDTIPLLNILKQQSEEDEDISTYREEMSSLLNKL